MVLAMVRIAVYARFYAYMLCVQICCLFVRLRVWLLILITDGEIGKCTDREMFSKRLIGIDTCAATAM